MTRICRRILCIALVLMMGVALLPELFAESAKADSTLGIVTKDDVNVRQAPSMKGKLYCKAKKNTVVEVRSQTNAEGYTWYEVLIQDTESKYAPWYDGYIRGDCFRMLSDEEAATYGSSYVVPSGSSVVTAAPTANPASEGTGSAIVTAPPATRDANVPEGTVGTINDWGVNFRAKPNGAIMKSLDKGTKVNVLSIPATINRSNWYRVEYEGNVGYIMSVYLTVTGVDTSTVTNASSATPTPTPTPASSSSSSSSTTVTSNDALGYVQTTKGSVNIRASIGGTVITTVARWQTFPYLLAPVKRGNYTWYFIRVNNNIQGYIRGDCVKVVSKPVVTATPVPVVTPTADPSQPTATPTPTPTPAPQPENPTGYLKTTMSDVNIRKGVAGDVITVAKKKGTQFPYYGEPTVRGKVKWYKIYDASFTTSDHFAYIHGNFVTLVDPSGNTPTPAPVTPTATPTAAPTTNPGGKNEAEYVTLRPGSSGTAVSMLVSELKNQGYFTGEVTSKYNSKVENAVRAFQTAKGLAVDGIAGANTQHALFNTVPVGTADRTNLTMTIYPAEVIDWFTGGIQELWPRGANVKVYDVKTQKVWWAHR